MKKIDIEVVDSKYGKVVINKNDKYIGSHLKHKHEWADDDLKILLSVIKNGNVVIEVGANIGSHTIAFADAVGESGSVIAFEPQRIVFLQLAATVILNGFSNVNVHMKAVGKEAGKIKVPAVNYWESGNFGGVSLIASPINSSEVDVDFDRGEFVDVVCIDDIDINKLDLLKIDAEGMEPDILAGAARTIKKFRPVIYAEWDPCDIDKTTSTVRILTDLDYRLFTNPTNGNYNFFCIPNEWGKIVNGFKEIVLINDELRVVTRSN